MAAVDDGNVAPGDVGAFPEAPFAVERSVAGSVVRGIDCDPSFLTGSPGLGPDRR